MSNIRFLMHANPQGRAKEQKQQWDGRRCRPGDGEVVNGGKGMEDERLNVIGPGRNLVSRECTE